MDLIARMKLSNRLDALLLNRLDALFAGLIQTVQSLYLSNLEAPRNEQNPTYERFLGILYEGVALVKICEKTSCYNIFQKLRHASKIHQLEKEICDFVQYQMPAHSFVEITNLITELKSLRHLYELPSVDERNVNQTIVPKLTNDPLENATMLQQVGTDGIFDGAFDHFAVGLEKNIWNLKQILLQREVSVVGVQGMGGVGKTTVALALCNDPDIKGAFRNNIIFITVSKSPDLMRILDTMWQKIFREKRPEFQNVEGAHKELQQHLLRQAKPTLVVLDDVWSRVGFEMLVFEGQAYKTLVTTRVRSIIPCATSTQLYELPLLDDADALSLICFWAFGQRSVPSNADEFLVKQVQAECEGLPLALKVIGSSLHGEPSLAWESAKNKLLKGEVISDYHKEGVLKCLETSIDVLDEEALECFLDLGSFPKDKKILAGVLLDIWVYVREMEWQDAFVILLELASRNLLNLNSKDETRGQALHYGSASELYVSLNGVMRHLVLYLASHDRLVKRKRLLMSIKEDSLPGKWEQLKHQAFDAQIVSLHTGAMEEDQWCEINFFEAEALVLIFSAKKYFLPTFLSSMRKLKVLIVFNYGSKRAIVNGLPALSSLIQLRTIHLEKLHVPPLQEHSKVWEKLEKLSLRLCEGLGNMSIFNNTQSSVNLPKMLDFNLDLCCDLEELPPGICNMSSVKSWTITNCHLLRNLPDDLGKLSSLRMLRLSACLGLKELPQSIGKLGQLEYLDISLCECLKELPEEMGQLRNLEKLDMRECSGLRKLPKSVGGMKSLRRVICDEKIRHQWERVMNSASMDLRVEVAEEHFLNWFDD